MIMNKMQNTIESLLSKTTQDPAMQRLQMLYKAGPARHINIVGPNDTQKAWLAMALSQTDGRCPVILVPDELRARALAADLKAMTDKPVLVFRGRELNLTDAEAVSRESELKRLAILSALSSPDSFGALVVTAAAALQKVMPRQTFEQRLIRLQVGQRLGMDELCRQLLANGYERMRLVDGPGQFAQRGDIIDIVPASPEDGEPEQGIRLSFFDIEIDAIKLFDLESQRSSSMLQSVVLPPAREILIEAGHSDRLAESIIAAGQAARAEMSMDGAGREAADGIRNLCRHDAERVSARIVFAGLDRWLPLIYPDADSILDYCPHNKTVLFLDEPLRFRNRLDAAQAEWAERIKSMLAKGQALPMTADAVFRGGDISIKLDRSSRIMALCQIASSGNGMPGAAEINVQGRPADSYRGREEQLIRELSDWRRTGGLALLFAGSEARQSRLRGLLSEHGLDEAVLDRSLPRGFVWPAAGLLVVGTQDIFGSERPARRRHQAGIRIDLFSDLVPGEMVVHEAHGIGRYEGLVNLENKGVRRDYLKIVYAGDDSLYIPMESLDQIQKYVGAEGKEPKLSKLGGQEWTRMKERARDSIRKLATDLIKLYAERSSVKGFAFSPDTVWQQEFEENFPYEETEDQLRSIQEIKQDMESDKVMDRLLCGDVGFGKTEVAFRAMFKCVMDSKQALLLAPTTVLAQQHYENLNRRMAGFPVNIGLLSRFASEAMQKNTLHGLAYGKIDIAVGTHRLLSKDVKLKNLGLLIVDEEQRFGVDHKEQIKAISPNIDVLTLTATPIPRTLHMSMSGIRDISVLEEPPHDRRPVQTYVMEYDEEILVEAMLREISRNGQVFYLFNDTRRIMEKAAALEKLLPGARVAFAHGKMSEKRLEEIITEFIEHQSDILVCTTIIESGIDMPNVNTIIVEDADRLGLAQLYQLRGRVGRSDRQAFAYVTYRRDKVLSEVAEKRLAAIRDFTELGAGFKIALRDLEVRGAGNLLGAEQHGQLDAIGYDLYCRMLEETIQEMQGKAPVRKIQASIELDIDAFITKSYIPDEGQRMDMYRRVAAIDTAAEYQDVLDEMLDRYGEPPAAAIALADIAFVRASAEKSGFAAIRQQQQNLVLNYADNIQPDMAVLSKLLNLPAYKGQLLFNAGTKPYVVFRNAAREKVSVAENLRKLFIQVTSE
ncbi:MAG TPA: transcription-repair coupling factor [Clostridiales bacterium]|nr:transcription-repair coupling factor [Clostridiales bacterium]